MKSKKEEGNTTVLAYKELEDKKQELIRGIQDGKGCCAYASIQIPDLFRSQSQIMDEVDLQNAIETASVLVIKRRDPTLHQWPSKMMIQFF